MLVSFPDVLGTSLDYLQYPHRVRNVWPRLCTLWKDITEDVTIIQFLARDKQWLFDETSFHNVGRWLRYKMRSKQHVSSDK